MAWLNFEYREFENEKPDQFWELLTQISNSIRYFQVQFWKF